MKILQEARGFAARQRSDSYLAAARPGLRPEYDANYYGAFVRDPDGNKIEAVTFRAE